MLPLDVIVASKDLVTAARMQVLILLVSLMVLQKVSEHFVRPGAIFGLQHLLALVNDSAAHLQHSLARQILLPIDNLTGVVRDAGHFEHLDRMRGLSSARQTRVVERKWAASERRFFGLSLTHDRVLL